MGCFGIYYDLEQAERVAGGETNRHVVPAKLDGEDAFAVVDSADRESDVEYDSSAPPGHRFTTKARAEATTS